MAVWRLVDQRQPPAPPGLALWPALALLLLAACSSPGPRQPLPSAPSTTRDGPGPQVPPWLDFVPEAQPRVEPLRSGGPNKPYEVLGRRYTPATSDIPWQETGLASWYGARFHGRPTASGEPYDMYAMTAAHKTLPLPSYVRVRNPANGREVVLRINDRGPFVDGRVIDLSYAAAHRLGLLAGVGTVEVVRITHDEIRAAAAGRGPMASVGSSATPGPAGRPGPSAAGAAAAPSVPAQPPDDDPLGAMLVDRGLLPPPDKPPPR